MGASSVYCLQFIPYLTSQFIIKQVLEEEEKVSNSISMLMMISWEQKGRRKNVKTPLFLWWIYFCLVIYMLQNISSSNLQYDEVHLETNTTFLRFSSSGFSVYDLTRNWRPSR